MYRPQHPAFSLQNCITMQNRLPLTFVPKQYTTYFINSKRRFFLYFKYREEMNQVTRIFEKQNVRFHQRTSMFPDREQLEEIVFHCNYKYKKKDLRWALHRDTKLRQPVNKFYQRKLQSVKQLPKEQKTLQIKPEPGAINPTNRQIVQFKQIVQEKNVCQMQLEQTMPEYAVDFGQIQIKNPEVLKIINNIELVKALFKQEKKK